MAKASAERKKTVRDICNTHERHEHQHGDSCGHKAVKHGNHVDYVHGRHLHRIHGNHVDECEGRQTHPKKSK